MEALQQAPVFQIVIVLQAGTGNFQVAWPNVDPITKLGMLEAAKAYLMADMLKSIDQAKSGIILPPPGTKLA